MAEEKKELTPIQQISKFMNGNDVKAKFAEMLGARAPQFISSVMSAVNANPMLHKATQMSVYGSALMAATLDLPVNGNLGFAYIVPFTSKKKDPQTGRDYYENEAQFQLGSKGFIQLAMRSGQYAKINVSEIYEGQLKIVNPVTEEYKFNKPKSDKIVGYIAYFKLLNGFEKYLYMTVDELKKHGEKYSKTYEYGVWNSNFDAMARKTVIKRLLSKYGILSIEMQKAQVFDQAVVSPTTVDVQDIADEDITYVDNEPAEATEEEKQQMTEKQQKVADFMKENK